MSWRLNRPKSAPEHFISESVSFENPSLKPSYPLSNPHLNEEVIRDEIRISTSSWPIPDGVIVMALSVKSRRAGQGFAKKIVLGLIQSFGFALRPLLVFYLILFIALSLFILLMHSGACALHLGVVSESRLSVLHCYALKIQGNVVL